MLAELKLEKFQGPLDLLLQLIEREELKITEVALSHVTDRYFQHLSKVEQKQPEELADFLVVATKLVYLKSRELLPYLHPEADEGPSLAEQLKLYKRYADASKLIAELWNRGLAGYGRVEPLAAALEFVPPQRARAGELHSAMVFLLARLKPIAPLPEVTIDHSVSVKQQVEHIYSQLGKLKKFHFSDILKSAESRTGVIISFLALLELIKQSKVAIHQNGAFGEMEIQKV